MSTTSSATRIMSASCSTTTHRVALIAQLPEDGDQPQVVARVQADRRLVEDVERADERRAERGRQADALRLAARQRRREPIERQVVETDVVEERQAALDLAQHLLGDRRLARRQLQRREEAPWPSRTVSAQTAIDRPAGDAHVARLAPQPRAAALRARLVAAVAAQEDADVDLVLLPLEPLEEALDAAELAVAARARRRARDRSARFHGTSRRTSAGLGAPSSSPRAGPGSAACSTARSAPPASVLVASGTTSPMSSSITLPKPWQVGQAPNGLLNEKSRGCGTS